MKQRQKYYNLVKQGTQAAALNYEYLLPMLQRQLKDVAYGKEWSDYNSAAVDLLNNQIGFLSKEDILHDLITYLLDRRNCWYISEDKKIHFCDEYQSANFWLMVADTMRAQVHESPYKAISLELFNMEDENADKTKMQFLGDGVTDKDGQIVVNVGSKQAINNFFKWVQKAPNRQKLLIRLLVDGSENGNKLLGFIRSLEKAHYEEYIYFILKARGYTDSYIVANTEWSLQNVRTIRKNLLKHYDECMYIEKNYRLPTKRKMLIDYYLKQMEQLSDRKALSKWADKVNRRRRQIETEYNQRPWTIYINRLFKHEQKMERRRNKINNNELTYVNENYFNCMLPYPTLSTYNPEFTDTELLLHNYLINTGARTLFYEPYRYPYKAKGQQYLKESKTDRSGFIDEILSQLPYWERIQLKWTDKGTDKNEIISDNKCLHGVTEKYRPKYEKIETDNEIKFTSAVGEEYNIKMYYIKKADIDESATAKDLRDRTRHLFYLLDKEINPQEDKHHRQAVESARYYETEEFKVKRAEMIAKEENKAISEEKATKSMEDIYFNLYANPKAKKWFQRKPWYMQN